ncbi:MAG: hypothetical protein ACI3XQ_06340 [Eubacteriales bacterium]
MCAINKLIISLIVLSIVFCKFVNDKMKLCAGTPSVGVAPPLNDIVRADLLSVL